MNYKYNRKLTICVVFVLALMLLPTNILVADTTGQARPSNMSCELYGSTDWTVPQNAMVSDNNYATCFVDASSQATSYLKAQGFNFAIPAGSTINGIVVDVERSQTIGYAFYDEVACLIKNDTVVSASNRVPANSKCWWPAVDTVKTYGSPTDLWGQTLTVADINDPNFGFAIAARKTWNIPTARIDYIGMTVYYTPTALDDTTPPVITQCDIITEATSALGSVVNFTPNATDNVDSKVTVLCSPFSGAQFPLGTTPVTCTAMDAAGNEATPVTFNVTVKDTSAPVITLNGTDPYNIAYASTYNEPGALWTDAVDGTGSASIGGDTVNPLVPGPYIITYNYTDAAGNEATQITRTVNVLPWATINITIDIFNWKGMETGEPDVFTIQKDGADDKSVSETITATYDRLPPGTYIITELPEAKFTLQQIIGDDDADATNGAVITVDSGQTVTLTFINWIFQPNKK